MKKFLILFITLFSFEALAQVSIDFIDTTGFHVIHLNDTIDAVTNSPYPDYIGLDLYCDGEIDIYLKCFRTVVPVYPQAHHIDVHNLTGANLEFAIINWSIANVMMADAFNTGETVDADTLIWASESTYKIMYFFVLSGPTWAGIENPTKPPMRVSDMNLLFRFTNNGDYKYGWINYSGYAWPAELVIHKIAFEESLCTSTPTNQISESNFKLFPNPFSSHLYLLPNQSLQNSTTWKIYAIDGTFIDQGSVEPNTFIILDNNKVNKAGTYIIQFFIDGKFIESQTIIKI